MKKILFLIFVALLAPAIAASAQSKVLKLNLKKGNIFNQKMEVSSKMTQNMMGQQMEVITEMKGELRCKVLDIEDDNYIMEVNYTKLSTSVKSPAAGVEMTGSSETPDAGDMMSPLLNLMVNKPFTVTMAPTGRIVKVDGIEKMYEGLSEVDALSSLPPEAAEQVIKQLKESYGGESIKSNMETGTAIFPDRPLSPGDSWSTDFSLDNAMKLKMQTTYTLVEMGKDQIVVHAETAIKSGDGSMEVQGTSVKYDLAGTMSSEIRLDPKTLWTDSSETKMNLNGNLSVSNPQMGQDITIPLNVETTTSYVKL